MDEDSLGVRTGKPDMQTPSQPQCAHPEVRCLNPYEFIRKYECLSCRNVMMCACDETFARRFLAHQLREGSELETQKRIPVTLGFRASVCNACRGLPEQSCPKAPRYGSTSKIQRYYWREIWFETKKRFADWCDLNEVTENLTAEATHADVHKKIEREVIEEMKALHERSPKYRFEEESQSDVLRKHSVAILKLDGVYVRSTQRRAVLLSGSRVCSAEEFAAEHYEKVGYSILHTESRPFHVLFGVYFWLLIQDQADPNVRIVGFGARGPHEQGQSGRQIWTHLPEDFGTTGYAERRSDAIDEQFASMLRGDTDDLLWAFDYWLPRSEGLREYLWAHDPKDAATARQLVQILPPDILRRILRYLIGAYWKRYCGWPDLFAYKAGDFVFLEVKSSKDELSEDQKHWIEGNASDLHLPFMLVKIHKTRVVDPPDGGVGPHVPPADRSHGSA